MDNNVELQIPLEDMDGYKVVISMQDNNISIKRFIDRYNNLIIPSANMLDESNHKIKILKRQMDSDKLVEFSSN